MPSHVNPDDLYEVLNQIDEYPVDATELVEHAQEMGASEGVVDFLESIPSDTMFETEAEVVSMAEQISDPSLSVDSGTLSGDLEEIE